MDDNTPIPAERYNMTQRRFVNKYAVAAGVMSIAKTSTIPTVASSATNVKSVIKDNG